MNTKKLSTLIAHGLDVGAYSCYAAVVGCKDDLLFKEFGGKSAMLPSEKEMTEDTLFDMASLSKLIGTTMAALKLIECGKLRLDSKVGDFFDECHGKENMTVFELMTHTSGIKAHFPLWLRGIAPKDAADEILREPFGYTPKSNAVYTCMGYILFGKMIERIEGLPLDAIVQKYVFDPLGMKNSYYNPPSGKLCAATEKNAQTGEIICGRVHDENADFLNGVSGNAGIFCDINDCIRFAKMLSLKGAGFLDSALFESATADKTSLFSEHRGLGFQLVGKRYGHNGFTGTSIYVDRESSVYAILLTNRIHPTRENHLLFPIRNEWHKEIFGE